MGEARASGAVAEVAAAGRSGLRPTYRDQQRGTSATQLVFLLAEGRFSVLRTSWYLVGLPEVSRYASFEILEQ